MIYLDTWVSFMLGEFFNSGKEKLPLIVMHTGFGCDLRFWYRIVDKLKSDYDILILAENYFNDTKNVMTVDDVLNITVGRKIVGGGHSLGYAKIVRFYNNNKNKFNLTKIFAIEGFSNFLSNNSIIRCRRKLSLDTMIKLYRVNLIQTFVMFQFMCGEFFNPLIPSDVNKELFFNDLNELNSSCISPDLPHLVLSSIDDPIIPWYVIEDNFRLLPSVEIDYTFGTSHLLGDRHPYYVTKKLKSFIRS